jgi:hypothetical protein
MRRAPRLARGLHGRRGRRGPATMGNLTSLPSHKPQPFPDPQFSMAVRQNPRSQLLLPPAPSERHLGRQPTPPPQAEPHRGDIWARMPNGLGGDDAAECLRFLVATKARTVEQVKLRGL